ncbi:MAG TPA: hypothetical protein VJZ70_02735 [Limnochordia bacterium]|nr:hypothetical protein [Limnochordia bacterium]
MGVFGNMSLLAMLIVVLIVIFYVRKKTSYTLDVTIEPKGAATISEITYKKVPGSVVAQFSLKIEEGYTLRKWTGTLPRLEGYDPARWYDQETGKVRLEIDKSETVSIHFDQVRN